MKKYAEAKEGGRELSVGGESCGLEDQVVRASATSSDEEKVDNRIEPESVIASEREGRDEHYGGLDLTSVSKEEEGSNLEDKTEPIDPQEDCGRIEDLKNLESTTVNEKVAREAAVVASSPPDPATTSAFSAR